MIALQANCRSLRLRCAPLGMTRVKEYELMAESWRLMLTADS